MKKVLGILSDDLTGAADTVVQFTRRNLSGLVVFHAFELPSNIHAVAVNSASRGLPEKDAVTAVIESAHLLKRFPITSLYKKIDSTLRGHLALEIETLLDVFEMELALVAPAYPANNRITVDGQHFVDQIPVAESEVGHDPLCPVRESHLPTLFRKTSRLKIGHLSLSVLQDGFRSVQKTIRRLRTEGVRILVCDAAASEHLDMLADFLQCEGGILACGSAGLAKALASRMSSIPKAGQPAHNCLAGSSRTNVPPALVVAGSCSDITVRQIEQFRSHKKTVGLSISPEQLLTQDAAPYVEHLIASTTESLQSGYDVILHLTTTSSGSFSLDRGRLLADRLGEIALKVLEKPSQISGLILTGGDIAKAVCEHLQIDGIEFYHELYPAVPVGSCLGGIRPGLTLLTKGGGCGSEDILSAAVNYLRRTPFLRLRSLPSEEFNKYLDIF